MCRPEFVRKAPTPHSLYMAPDFDAPLEDFKGYMA